ncbi:MAG TPA: Flp family type IVb pilin [Candidatus Baltobacteraceae bacterium]|nr:Flp family type IVb pilin [Candidatus Baltobacteraceae bacterium]
MIQRWRGLALDESGATMVEYAIMLAFIAAVCVVLVVALGNKTSSQFSNFNATY